MAMHATYNSTIRALKMQSCLIYSMQCMAINQTKAMHGRACTGVVMSDGDLEMLIHAQARMPSCISGNHSADGTLLGQAGATGHAQPPHFEQQQCIRQ
eukprot:1149165-Pelagomonas_calceolata.AAC.4